MFKWFKSKTVLETLDVPSPITGKAVSIETVPDPAFAQKQMGEGIAIEPAEGKVFAPFSGKVAHLVKSKHAVILEHASGAQLLIHVGINTVSLKGSAFTAHVATGDKVKAGQLLIEFDIDQIKAAGYPIITPVLVPDGLDAVKSVETSFGDVTAKQDHVLNIHLKQ